MTFQDFLSTQHQLAEPLLLRLIRNIEDRELELELIVTGVDASGGHIYRVTDPGTSDCFDAVGFCAIGSGEHHAELAFIRSSYSPNVSLNQALFLAYQAKRDAEMAPGVGGQFTDLGVIDDEGFHFVHDDVLTQLKTAYEELRLYHNSGHSKVEATIDSMQLRWVDENQ